MITCSVCGGLNNPNNAVCEHCGSDLIDETEYIALFNDDDSNESCLDDNDDSNESYLYDDDDYGDY